MDVMQPKEWLKTTATAAELKCMYVNLIFLIDFMAGLRDILGDFSAKLGTLQMNIYDKNLVIFQKIRLK